MGRRAALHRQAPGAKKTQSKTRSERRAAKKASSLLVATTVAPPSIGGRKDSLRSAITGSQPRASTVLPRASPELPAEALPALTSAHIALRAASAEDMLATARVEELF
jgi:hypothetical protein